MSNDNSGGQGPVSGGDSGSQSRYYQRYEEASGEAITAGNKTSGGGPGGRRGLLLAVGAVVVAIIVVAAVVGVNLVGGDDDATQARSSSSASPRASSSSPSATSSDQEWTNPDAAPTQVRPLKPGWTAVLAQPRLASAAYDVPTKHWYKPGDMDYGYHNDETGDTIAVGDAAGYRQGFCKSDEAATLAFIGFHGIGSMDPAQKTPEVVDEFADAITLEADDSSHAPRSKTTTKTTTVQGLPGVLSTVTATNGDVDKKSCEARKIEVRGLGVSMGGKSTLLVLVRALDVPHALTDAQAKAIMQTLRPADN